GRCAGRQGRRPRRRRAGLRARVGRRLRRRGGAGARRAGPVRVGRRVGVDVGTVRIGTALSDPDGLLAVPLETVPRGPGDVARIVELVAANAAVEVVVGLPVSLDGTEGPSAAAVRSFADGLA